MLALEALPGHHASCTVMEEERVVVALIKEGALALALPVVVARGLLELGYECAPAW